MDTRSKILTGAEAHSRAKGPLAVVIGTFDGLRAAHVHEIEAARRLPGVSGLLVLVLPGAGKLLPQRARAELVAALRSVDYVVLAGADGLTGLLQASAPVHVVNLEAIDRRLSSELWQRVLSSRDRPPVTKASY